MKNSALNTYHRSFAEECMRRAESTPEFGYDLEPHQVEAMRAIADALIAGKRTMSIVNSGGSGKTVLEAAIAQASLAAKQRIPEMRGKKDVVLTTERLISTGVLSHFSDVLQQEVGAWHSNCRELNPDVIIASIQAVQVNRKNLKNLLPPRQISLLLGDEADMYLSDKRRRIVESFRGAIRIGFTATPQLADGRHIDDVWGEHVHHMPLKEGIERGVNAPPLYYLYQSDIQVKDIKMNGDDYDRAALERAMMCVQVTEVMPQIYQELIPTNRRKEFPTLGYLPSINVLQETLTNFRKQCPDVRAEAWWGRVTNKQLLEQMEAFNNRDIDVLLLCEMGGRGLNLPSARCILDGSPTAGLGKLEQRLSRGLRIVRPDTRLAQEGFQKPFTIIAQLLPSCTKVRPVTLLDILDCYPNYVPGKLLDFGNGNGHGGGNRPSEEDVRIITEHIRKSGFRTSFTMVEKVDIFSQMQTHKELPEVNDDGVIELDGERYGTLNFWRNQYGRRVLGHVAYSDPEVGECAIPGKAKSGRIYSFIPERFIRQKCPFLDHDVADDRGVIARDGKGYAFREALVQLGYSDYLVEQAIRSGEVTHFEGVDIRMRERAFYSVAEIDEYCKKRGFKKLGLLRAQQGYKEVDGVPCATITGLSGTLGKSESAIARRIKRNNMEGYEAVNQGHRTMVYPIETIRALFPEAYEQLPDSEGFVNNRTGEKMAPITVWGKVLPWVSRTQIEIRLKKNPIPAVRVTDRGGNVRDYYTQSQILELCKDLQINSKDERVL